VVNNLEPRNNDKRLEKVSVIFIINFTIVRVYVFGGRVSVLGKIASKKYFLDMIRICNFKKNINILM
jgi:hypothetical protein